MLDSVSTLGYRILLYYDTILHRYYSVDFKQLIVFMVKICILECIYEMKPPSVCNAKWSSANKLNN